MEDAYINLRTVMEHCKTLVFLFGLPPFIRFVRNELRTLRNSLLGCDQPKQTSEQTRQPKNRK